MRRFLLICLIFFPVVLAAQPHNFVRIEKTGINNYSLVYSAYYDGNSLWGYMDGGADLYLEYGFEGLLVQEINYRGSAIKCEIFKMKDALAAFGIFSVQRHNCNQYQDMADFHCVNNYQLQLVRGNYYLSLINSTGDSMARKTAAEAADWLCKLIEKQEIAFPEDPLFHDKQNLIFLKGKISLGNVYPEALSYLENIQDYSMWIVPSLKKQEPVISCILFNRPEDMQEYAGAAFPQQELNQTVQKKQKNGGIFFARKVDDYQVLQVDGKAGKELKKILGIQ